MIKTHTSTDGQYYFTVCGKNGKVIVTSKNYPTTTQLVTGLKSFFVVVGGTDDVSLINEINRNKKTMDRKLVAGTQDYEVNYIAKKFGVSKNTVRQAMLSANSISRKEIYKVLRSMGFESK